MPNDFTNRKKQIEKDFLPKLMRDLKVAGCSVNRKGRALIKKELRDAAMVGACEERSRTLRMLGENPDHKELARAITKQGVLAVLGYED